MSKFVALIAGVLLLGVSSPAFAENPDFVDSIVQPLKTYHNAQAEKLKKAEERNLAETQRLTGLATTLHNIGGSQANTRGYKVRLKNLSSAMKALDQDISDAAALRKKHDALGQRLEAMKKIKFKMNSDLKRSYAVGEVSDPKQLALQVDGTFEFIDPENPAEFAKLPKPREYTKLIESSNSFLKEKGATFDRKTGTWAF